MKNISRLPIHQAPMAGGPSTVALAAAVANAGGMGWLAAAYLTPAQITAAVRQLRAATDQPFGVNLFATATAPLRQSAEPTLALLAPLYQEMSLPSPVVPEQPAPRFEEQARAVLETGVAAFSFTFGVAEPELIAAFRAAGIRVSGTATSTREAMLLVAAGVDEVIAQGAEAGGHRGTFAGSLEEGLAPLAALLPDLLSHVRVPVVAAGGLRDGEGVAAVLRQGASAAMLGTAFLPCPESGAIPSHKAAVLAAAPGATVLTRALSGRWARGLRNRLIDVLEADPSLILPFPWQNAVTAPLRSAAAANDRAEFATLWAGEGRLLLGTLPAADLVHLLAQQAGL